MINYASIPEAIKYTLDAWSAHAQLPGGFCQAVLENNLQGAFARADDESLTALHSIVAYVYNKLPSQCWGSPEKLMAWAEAKRVEPRRI